MNLFTKFKFLIALCCLGFGTINGQSLLISGIFDGDEPGGLPKGVELYVTADIADLSAYGLGAANNGGGTDGEEFTFPVAAATAGDYIYVASESTVFTSFFGFAPDYTDNALNINGDDAVELFFNGAVIDTYGDPNTDGTGEPWEYDDSWAYRNDMTGPDATFVIGNWNIPGVNTWDNDPCTVNANCVEPMPIGTYMGESTGAACSELFMSEYVEGASFDKAIEVYNPTGATIDLAAGGYFLNLFSNGANAPGGTQTFALTGMLASGDVFVVAHPSASAGLLAVADATDNSAINFNGDDAIALTVGGDFNNGGTVIDVIGQIGTDPGSQWNMGGVSTQNENLRRLMAVEQGDADGSDAFDPSAEWAGFDDADFSNFGIHMTACVMPSCTIGNIMVNSIGECDDKGTADPSDDTFTIDFTVGFMMAPATGTLDVSATVGSNVDAGTASVAIADLDSATDHNFVIEIPTFGGSISLSAAFSDEATCQGAMSNVGDAPVSCSTTPCSDLFFSEYIEGTSFNKCLEIYNPSSDPVDLTGYSVEIYTNGNTNVGNSVNLSGIIAPLDVFVICNNGATGDAQTETDLFNNGVTNFNGNDVLILTKNGFSIDAIGQIGNNSNFAQNQTILKRVIIPQGDNNPFDAFTVSDEWDVFPVNTNEDLGQHYGVICPSEIAIADPCVCLDNATNDDDGQFGELVEVTARAGDTWQVIASTGLYQVDASDASVVATAGVVYPLFPVDGLQLVEVFPGTYQLAGVHVDDEGYSVTVQNLFTGETLTIGNECVYPDLNVTGLDNSNGACVADVTYNFTVTPNADGTLTVTVDGVAMAPMVVAENNATPISIDVAALGTGSFDVELAFDADEDLTVPANQPGEPGCIANYTYTLMVGEPAGTMTCNDEIQFSLNENCEIIITPDMLLEGTYDNNAFEISIAGVTGDILNGSHIGNEYVVTVSDACGPNSCWSIVTVEDKLAPTINCINTTIVCTADISTVDAPFALDNCDTDPTVTLIEQVLADQDVCDDGQVVYAQTYVAIDDQGNQSTPCERFVMVVRPENFQVNFPDDIVWSCEQYAAHPYIIDAVRINPNISNGFGTTYSPFDVTGAWNLTNIAVNSFLLTQNVALTDPLRATGSGIPTEIDGTYCGYNYASADNIVETCGFVASTDSPVFKIIRTWTVLNWCTGEIVIINSDGEDNVQTIKVIDDEVPTVVGADVTVSTNIPGTHPQPCKGQGPVVMATATDNCTGADNIQGFVYSDITLNAAIAQIDPNTGLIEPALAVGCYFLVWTAEDACGNVGQSTTYDLCIEDNVAPVAVCDEVTQVALSSDGEAVVYAETFDDGSYDNCCLDRLEVRRMAQTCSILGNTTFNNDNHPDDSNNDPDNGEFVTFCCTDIDSDNADDRIVVLRAYDCEGNYNECMVQVLLEDKLAPTIVCPPNAALTCDEYADDLAAALLACADAADEDDCQSAALTAANYGTSTALDNCAPNIDVRVTVSIDQCGAGTVVREFITYDDSDNGTLNFNGFNPNSPSSCRQTITVTHVSDWVVEFPADQEGFCDMDEPSFGEPEIFFESCELIATSFEDEFFNIVADACFKIVRTWTVINWCVVGSEIDQESNAIELAENQLVPQQDLDGDGDRDGRTFRDSYRGVLPTSDNDPDADNQDGFITYQQIIKIQDDEAPVIDPTFEVGDLCIITGNDGTDNDFSDCTFSGILPTPEYDDCILDVNGNLDSNGEVVDNDLIITAEVFDSNGDLVSNSVVVNDLEIGCYVVRYLAVDRCGNSTAQDFDFCVEDCKAPTPYCVQGLVIELMAVNDPNNDDFFPMIDIWASDFDAGSFDNCDMDVDISFTSNPLDTGLVFTCNGFLGDNITPASGGSIGDHLVQIYVTDDAGNQSFCETVIQVQANQDQCDNGTPLVAGTVETEQNAGVENVEMNANGNGMSNMLMTNIDGVFNMNLPQGGDYTLVPEKDVEPLNGVSTFDLVKISKHILNIESLDSPYKMIAADINNSQSITTLDLVKLRRLILLIDTEFSNNTSWRFVDAAYTFPNPTNPWAETFPEIININNLDADMMNGDFVAVKIGDINASASTNNLLGADDRTTGDMTLTAQSSAVKAGEMVRVDFTANDFMALGMQFTLNFNQTALDFVAIENGVATDENFGLTLLDEGAITFSWNTSDAVRLTNNEVLFTLVFNGNADTQISDVLSIDSKYTTAEAYNANEEILDVNLNFNGTAIAGAFELHQNRPNPFSDETTISFNLPTAQNATITVSDVSGKVLKVIQNNFAKGYNEINLAKADLNATGVLYYTLATSENSSTKMMVLTK